VGRTLVHDEAMPVIRDWIKGLPNTEKSHKE
jgi:hypothetical protein